MGLSTLVVVNSEARNVRSGLRWAGAEADVMRRLAPAELEIVDSAADAEQVAWDAAMAGYGRLIVAGDLATASRFVNGIMRLADSHRRGLKIGFLSLGRPDAWCRALGLSSDVGRQLDVLSAGNVLPYDVGRVDCLSMEGNAVTRHFLAGAALWPSAMDTQPGATVKMAQSTDGEIVHQGDCHAVFAMQCPDYPGMGQVAPQANPSDGALSVAWVEARGAGALAQRFMVSLLHLPLGLSRRSAHEVRLSSTTHPTQIHADGVMVGQLPAVVTVVPRTLPVISESIGSKLREKQKAMLKELEGTALAGHYKRTEIR